MKKILICTLLVLLASCNTAPQAVTLRPVPHARTLVVPVGDEQPISVSVVNALPSKRIGDYGPNEIARADILVEDLVAPIQKELVEGLQRKAFKPTVGGDLPLSLQATVQSISYKATAGLIKKHRKVRVEMGVHAISNKRYLTKRYFAEAEDADLQVDAADKQHFEIDTVLADILTQILNDEELMTFLAQ